MLAIDRRTSGVTSSTQGPRRGLGPPVSSSAMAAATPQEDIWSSMLSSVASTNRLPERQLLVLGGTPDSQNTFLAHLTHPMSTFSSTGNALPNTNRPRRPPFANAHALGYTYHHVLDPTTSPSPSISTATSTSSPTSTTDILARLSLYTLSTPSAAFVPLVRPLLTCERVPNTLLVLLLDWREVWTWIAQVRAWIGWVRQLVGSVEESVQDVMEEEIEGWKTRSKGDGRGKGRGMMMGEGQAPDGETAGGTVELPLGPGEWDEPLGLPICVVAQNAEYVDTLEKQRGWKEEDFDYVLQFLRTVLLKHGASLIYIPSAPPSTSIATNAGPPPLQNLIHHLLSLAPPSGGVSSTAAKQGLKHNVISRASILIPPNWDSWGKIRVLREGFDVEGISSMWSDELHRPLVERQLRGENDQISNNEDGEKAGAPETPAVKTAVEIYEERILSPYTSSTLLDGSEENLGIEVHTVPIQDFLTKELEAMERLRIEEEKEGAGRESKGGKEGRYGALMADGGRLKAGTTPQIGEETSGRTRVEGMQGIGGLMTNVGGITVETDTLERRRKERELATSPPRQTLSAGTRAGGVATPESKLQNEKLASFFTGLMKRDGGSPANGPRQGGGAKSGERS